VSHTHLKNLRIILGFWGCLGVQNTECTQMALNSRRGLDEAHIGLHSNDHASKWNLNLGIWMKFKLDDWGSLTKNLVHPIIFFGLRKLMILF
jgi:hypothetical protein